MTSQASSSAAASSSASNESSAASASASMTEYAFLESAFEQEKQYKSLESKLEQEQNEAQKVVDQLKSERESLQAALRKNKTDLADAEKQRDAKNKSRLELCAESKQFDQHVRTMKKRLFRERNKMPPSQHRGSDSMRKISAQAKRHDAAAHEVILARFVTLGFTSADLEQCKKYIRDQASIIVAFDAEQLLPRLLEDPLGVYRTAFETKTSCGQAVSEAELQARAELESKHLFYPSTTLVDYRCHYGYLHLTDDPAGATELHQFYGDSYFVLDREAVADKVSITPDSSSMEIIDTLEYCCRYLNTLSDTELKLLRLLSPDPEQISDWTEIHALQDALRESASNDTTRECHIHKPISLAKHVVTMYLAPRLQTNTHITDVAQDLAKKHSNYLCWIDPDKHDYSTELAEMGE